MTLRLDYLGLDDPLPEPSAGAPMLLEVDSIDEDPEQPRREFDAQSLQELAATIEDRGVKQPVSVRPHPSREGRWLLNFGARRLRASKLAGKTRIPAFLDLAADSYDQVIENEQRESLQPLELALFVQKQMRSGTSPGDIAKRLGKSRGYLTYIGALIDAPDWLLDLYRSGRCLGITELYELRKLHDARPAEVEGWLVNRSHVSRPDILALKEGLKPAAALRPEPATAIHSMANSNGLTVAVASGSGTLPVTKAVDSDARTTASKIETAMAREVELWGEIHGNNVQVLLGISAVEAGAVCVLRPGHPDRMSVPISSISRLRLAFAPSIVHDVGEVKVPSRADSIDRPGDRATLAVGVGESSASL